jgi:hypothetical protein
VTGGGWRAAAALAAVSLVVSLFALEIGTRLWLDAGQRAALPHVGLDAESEDRLRWIERRVSTEEEAWRLNVPDALLGWRLRPHVRMRMRKAGAYDVVARVNHRGLRGKMGLTEQKPAGVTRVGVFGCSQTFGAGVGDGETFSARLAAGLPRAEVLNFGVGGYGTDQMLLYYESEGVRYDLDVVVLAFAYYHLERNLRAFKFFAKPRFELGEGGTLMLRGAPVPDPEVLARAGVPATLPLADRSILLRWMWERVLRRQEALAFRPDSAGWRLARAIITRFSEDVRRAGSRMVLLSVEDDIPQLRLPLAELARELSIDFVDAGRALGQFRGRGVRLRIPGDPHWSAAAHRMIATYLRDHLCRAGAVPCASGQSGDAVGAARRAAAR